MGQILTNKTQQVIEQKKKEKLNDPIVRSGLSKSAFNRPDFVDFLSGLNKKQDTSEGNTLIGEDESTFKDSDKPKKEITDEDAGFILDKYVTKFIEVMSSVPASDLREELNTFLLEESIRAGIPERLYNYMKKVCTYYNENNIFNFDVKRLKLDKYRKELLNVIKLVVKNFSNEIPVTIDLGLPINRLLAIKKDMINKNTREYSKPFYKKYSMYLK